MSPTVRICEKMHLKNKGWWFAMYENGDLVDTECFGPFRSEESMMGYIKNQFYVSHFSLIDTAEDTDFSTAAEQGAITARIDRAMLYARTPYYIHPAARENPGLTANSRMSRITRQKFSDMQELVPMWVDIFGVGEENAQTVRQLGRAAYFHKPLCDFFLRRFLNDWRLNPIKLAHWLVRHRDISINGMHIERVGWDGYNQIHKWAAVPVGGVYPRARKTPSEALLDAWSDNLGREDIGTYTAVEVLLSADQFPSLKFALGQINYDSVEAFEHFLVRIKNRPVNGLRLQPVGQDKWTVVFAPSTKTTDFPIPEDNVPEIVMLPMNMINNRD